MNYNNQQLIDMLAAEYTLGTLKGAARRRFQRLMFSSERVREATWMWEQHLNNLASSIKAIPPDGHVWEVISKRIDPEYMPKTTNVIKPKASIWKAWSVIATAASMVLALILFQPQRPINNEVQQVALFKDANEQTLWFIDINEQALSIKASNQFVAQTDKDYQLWMILKGQDTPISLGLLPKNGLKLLSKDPRFNAQDISLLAISLEPLGGSPNGLPTDVLYTTELILL